MNTCELEFTLKLVLTLIFTIPFLSAMAEPLWGWSKGNFSPVKTVLFQKSYASGRCQLIEAKNSNPAHTCCLKLGGKPRILYDVKKNQLSYCLLQDRYLVDAWEMYKLLSHD